MSGFMFLLVVLVYTFISFDVFRWTLLDRNMCTNACLKITKYGWTLACGDQRGSLPIYDTSWFDFLHGIDGKIDESWKSNFFICTSLTFKCQKNGFCPSKRFAHLPNFYRCEKCAIMLEPSAFINAWSTREMCIKKAIFSAATGWMLKSHPINDRK